MQTGKTKTPSEPGAFAMGKKNWLHGEPMVLIDKTTRSRVHLCEEHWDQALQAPHRGVDW